MAPAPEEGADLVGQEVVAFVQGMEMFAHTEEFSDGSVVVSHSTDLAVTEPRRLRYVVTVYTTGLPRIGDRRVQLGDVVQFVLPRNWRMRELTMADLENLRFRD